MERIIDPVDKVLVEKELTDDKFVRKTNNGENLLFIVTAHDSPNIMRELGRIRELSFREAGGGTGKSMDIDEYDTSDNPYKQLIVWDPHEREILGGYRYHNVKEDEEPYLSTTSLFHFSEKFKKEYLPYTIELGRSFVQPKYQSTQRRAKGMYALDNLWDGLGALVALNPSMKHFFGKVTMYSQYNPKARDILHYFMEKYFPDTEELVRPINPLVFDLNKDELASMFTENSYKEDHKILSKEIRELGERIPPLINSYMNISPSMKVFGTAINKEFGQVEETGIMITISEIYQAKIDRHVHTFTEESRIRD